MVRWDEELIKSCVEIWLSRHSLYQYRVTQLQVLNTSEFVNLITKKNGQKI